MCPFACAPPHVLRSDQISPLCAPSHASKQTVEINIHPLHAGNAPHASRDPKARDPASWLTLAPWDSAPTAPKEDVEGV